MKIKRGLALLALVGLVFVVFFQVVYFDFLNLDDPELVKYNASLLKPLSGELFFKPVAGLYHPITNLTYWIDARLFGLRPGAFHATNLLFHLASTCLVFFWIFEITRSSISAWVLAFLFALHPTHVESVVWISERKDAVSVFFFLACLLAFARGKVKWATCFAVLSFLAKPFALTLPFVLLAIEIWRRPEEEMKKVCRRHWLTLTILAVLAVVAGLQAINTQRNMGISSDLSLADLLMRIPNQLYFYLSKTFYPVDLRIWYSIDDIGPKLVPTFVLFTVFAGTIYLMRRSHEFRRDLIFGFAFFLLVLFPMLKLVHFGDDAPVANRYLYISQTGLFFPWANELSRRCGKKWAVITGLVLFYYTVTTIVWLPKWRSSQTIWWSILQVDPDNAMANENIGLQYLGAGDYLKGLDHLKLGQTEMWENQVKQAEALLRLGRFSETEDTLRKAEEIVGVRPEILNLRGRLYIEANQLQKAKPYLDQALALPATFESPLTHSEVLNNLGILSLRGGKIGEAIAWHSQALEILPNFALAMHNLALCYLYENKLEQARKWFEKTIELRPDLASAHNGLGVVAMYQKKLQQAEAHFKNALKYQPGLEMAIRNLKTVQDKLKVEL